MLRSTPPPSHCHASVTVNLLPIRDPGYYFLHLVIVPLSLGNTCDKLNVPFHQSMWVINSRETVVNWKIGCIYIAHINFIMRLIGIHMIRILMCFPAEKGSKDFLAELYQIPSLCSGTRRHLNYDVSIALKAYFLQIDVAFWVTSLRCYVSDDIEFFLLDCACARQCFCMYTLCMCQPILQ